MTGQSPSVRPTTLANHTVILLIFSCLMSIAQVGASTQFDPYGNITRGLSELHNSLKQFKLRCGRFPTTAEGLVALWHKPVGLSCFLWKKSEISFSDTPASSPGSDDTTVYVSGLAFRYFSNADGYRLDGESGYFVTNKSPEYPPKSGLYWERSSQPSNEIRPSGTPKPFIQD